MTDTRAQADPMVRELPIAAGGELELRLGANRLRVRTTDGDRVVIRGRTERDLERDVEITSGQGWVRVTDGPAGTLRLGPLSVRTGGQAPDLDVEVPRNVRISARTLSGDIEAVGVAGRSRWQSASGDVRVAAEGGDVAVDTVSGDVLIESRGPLGVAARTVSGSVRIRAPRLLNFDAATTSGNVHVDGGFEPGGHHSAASVSGDVRIATGSDVSLELQSVTGDIRATVPHVAGGARGRRTAVVGSGVVRIAVKTMSGDVLLAPGPHVGDGQPTAAGTDGWPEPSTPKAPVSWGPAVAPAPEPAGPVPSGASAAAPASLDETAPVPAATHAELEAARLEVLRALERGELDVEAAAERLSAIEDAAPAAEA